MFYHHPAVEEQQCCSDQLLQATGGVVSGLPMMVAAMANDILEDSSKHTCKLHFLATLSEW